MTAYRIRDWEGTFENNRTKELKRMRWFPVQNEYDGDGYTELVEGSQGAANYGSWMAIVGVASRCDPRGTLLRRDGSAHDPASISRITRLPVNDVERCWGLAISIGWLEPCGMSQEPAGISHPSAMEGNGREGKEDDGGGKPRQRKARPKDPYGKAAQELSKHLYDEHARIFDPPLMADFARALGEAKFVLKKLHPGGPPEELNGLKVLLTEWMEHWNDDREGTDFERDDFSMPAFRMNYTKIVSWSERRADAQKESRRYR